jgi:deazaflavin-dependent oxidoreductase (nitroreductase family)
MDGSLLLIIYRGRKSGKDYTLPVQYARHGDTIYIVPGMPEKKTWWRNLRGGAPVRLLLGGQALVGNAELLEGGAPGTLPALEAYLKRFPDAAAKPEDLNRLAQSTVVVEVKLS